MIFDICGNRLSRIPKRIGTIFFIGPDKHHVRPVRRGAGILLSAKRGRDHTLLAAWKRRARKRQQQGKFSFVLCH